MLQSARLPSEESESGMSQTLQERMDAGHMNRYQQEICLANIAMGMDEDEAYKRAQCSAALPEHFGPSRPVSTGEFPKMVYHPSPEDATAKDVFKVVKDAKEYAAAKRDGWHDKPSEEHLGILQSGPKLLVARPEPGEPALPLPKAKVRKAKAAAASTDSE